MTGTGGTKQMVYRIKLVFLIETDFFVNFTEIIQNFLQERLVFR